MSCLKLTACNVPFRVCRYTDTKDMKDTKDTYFWYLYIDAFSGSLCETVSIYRRFFSRENDRRNIDTKLQLVSIYRRLNDKS